MKWFVRDQTGSPRGGKIRTFFSFKIVAQIGFYAKRTPGTSYCFLGFGHLDDTLTGLFQEASPRKQRRNPIALAQEWQRLLDTGRVTSRAALARELGLSRAYVTLVLRLLQLEPSVQEVVLALGDPVQGRHIGVHMLRSLAMLQPSEQEWRVMALIKGTISRT